jgi:nucleotide-binding universal stress UspA family protein
MSATTALAILLIAWMVIGVVAAIVMGRRGHAPFSWMVLGAVLGPLVVPIMLSSMTREHPAPIASVGTSGTARARDGLDILFGYDGSEESRGALVTAAALLGPHIGRLTIATVLAFQPSKADATAAQVALDDVAELAAGLLDRRPATIALVGRPDDVLVQYAREHAIDLLVIAPRGRGATRALFGSVASRLARAPDVPVAIMPPAHRRIDDSKHVRDHITE